MLLMVIEDDHAFPPNSVFLQLLGVLVVHQNQTCLSKLICLSPKSATFVLFIDHDSISKLGCCCGMFRSQRRGVESCCGMIVATNGR